jgi:rhodanese-related sulfurtransferase
LLDLQSVESYRHRHVPGAVQLEDASRLAKDGLVVVYGEYDELGKGAEAADKLVAAGFTNVWRLQGGLMGWMEAGFTVEGGQES